MELADDEAQVKKAKQIAALEARNALGVVANEELTQRAAVKKEKREAEKLEFREDIQQKQEQFVKDQQKCIEQAAAEADPKVKAALRQVVRNVEK